VGLFFLISLYYFVTCSSNVSLKILVISHRWLTFFRELPDLLSPYAHFWSLGVNSILVTPLPSWLSTFLVNFTDVGLHFITSSLAQVTERTPCTSSSALRCRPAPMMARTDFYSLVLQAVYGFPDFLLVLGRREFYFCHVPLQVFFFLLPSSGRGQDALHLLFGTPLPLCPNVGYFCLNNIIQEASRLTPDPLWLMVRYYSPRTYRWWYCG